MCDFCHLHCDMAFHLMAHGIARAGPLLRTSSAPYALGPLVWARTASSVQNFTSTNPPKLRGAIDHDSIFVISLPITTKRSYFYCNHRPSVLDKSQLKTFPLVTKIETKATGLVKKGWNKLANSENRINKSIIKYVTKLLYTIPYEENCLRSFPSRNSMIREVNEEAVSRGKIKTDSGALVQQEITNLNIPSEQLKRIPLIHPDFQKPQLVLDQLRQLGEVNRPTHLKYSIACLVGVPLTLPFALVPVVPNVPGFYLAYRAYCHIKALLGVKHLDYLLENDSTPTPATKHLVFKDMGALSEVYEQSGKDLDLERTNRQEEVIITKDIIEDLCSRFDLAHLKEDLKKALDQESKRLSKKTIE